jgi:hypothetical protein
MVFLACDIFMDHWDFPWKYPDFGVSPRQFLKNHFDYVKDFTLIPIVLTPIEKNRLY